MSGLCLFAAVCHGLRPAGRRAEDRRGAAKLRYTKADLKEANRKAIALMTELREEFETESTPMVISGCIGPRGDGYEPGRVMTAQEAQVYHAGQVDTFAATGADMVTAITMTNIPEAIAITHAARSAKVPVVISFTVETDGNLPTGDSLKDAIATVDAATDHGPAYYMIICAHPVHFASALGDDLLDVPVIGAAMKRMKPSTISLRCQPNLQFESAKPCRP